LTPLVIAILSASSVTTNSLGGGAGTTAKSGFSLGSTTATCVAGAACGLADGNGGTGAGAGGAFPNENNRDPCCGGGGGGSGGGGGAGVTGAGAGGGGAYDANLNDPMYSTVNSPTNNPKISSVAGSHAGNSRSGGGGA
jgi:hypothetical protein